MPALPRPPRCIGLVLAALMLSACASTHNLREGPSLLGGGFIEEQLRPGLYRLRARSDGSMWPTFEAARSTWSQRADLLCGKDSYLSFDTDTNPGQRQPVPVFLPGQPVISVSTFNATITGYVLCASSTWSVDQARDFIRSEQARAERESTARVTEQLEVLGGPQCREQLPLASGENYYRRGRLLVSLQRHAEARACFIKVQEVEGDSSVRRQACEELGLMYEAGLGVEKDVEMARMWYRKAGL